MEAISNLKGLGGKKLAIIAGAGIAALLAILVLALSASDGSLAPLYTNMSLEDSNKIAAELDAKSMKYEIAASGTTILVPVENVLRLRMEFAEKGLPSQGSVVGYEIFDREEKLGSSSFVQNVNQVRALEGELARTIGAIQNIQLARVHLVLPKRELFNKDSNSPTASIQVTMKGSEKLSSGEIAAVRYLVASAVPGLSADNVTITDSRGILLARGGSNPNDPAIYASNAQEMKLAVENQMRNRIEELLEQYVGMGKVKAQVTADINFDREVTNSEIYDPEGQVARSIQSSTETEANKQSSSSSSDVSVANNLPDAAASSGANGSSDSREKTDEVTNFEISKTVKNHISESGKVNKLSVAVMVDGKYITDEKTKEMVYKDRTPEELAKLEALVKSAVGFDEKRGDKIEVANMKFSGEFAGEAKPSKFAFIQQDLQSVVQILVMGLVAAMVIMMVVRPLVKRALEVQAQQGLIDTPMPSLIGAAGVAGVLPAPSQSGAGAGAGAGGNANSIDGIEEEDQDGLSLISGLRGPSKPNSIKKINEVIDSNPEEALQIIRNWMYGQDAAA